MSDRTYDWNGHTGLPISYSHLTDEQMAGTVRMLMRHDLSHEGIVCGARDRIMCLAKENAAKDAEIAKLREVLKPFREVAGKLFAKNYNASDVVMDLTLEKGMKTVFLKAEQFFAIAAALEGGEA